MVELNLTNGEYVIIEVQTEIIEEYNLTENSGINTIAECINDYVSGLDGCYYYYIDNKEKLIILKEILEKLLTN